MDDNPHTVTTRDKAGHVTDCHAPNAEGLTRDKTWGIAPLRYPSLSRSPSQGQLFQAASASPENPVIIAEASSAPRNERLSRAARAAAWAAWEARFDAWHDAGMPGDPPWPDGELIDHAFAACLWRIRQERWR